MGFDFSAVTALLGGYSAARKRHPGSNDEFDEYRRRGDGRLRRPPVGPQDADGGGSGEIAVAARLDGPPVTGGATAVSGIGRALDALMSAEETRRRKASDGEGPAATSAAPLSTVLKASLPERKALPMPGDSSEEGRLPVARRDGERNWDEIREFIEALGRAERPAETEAKVEPATVKPSDVRPWRPKMAS